MSTRTVRIDSRWAHANKIFVNFEMIFMLNAILAAFLVQWRIFSAVCVRFHDQHVFIIRPWGNMHLCWQTAFLPFPSCITWNKLFPCLANHWECKLQLLHHFAFTRVKIVSLVSGIRRQFAFVFPPEPFLAYGVTHSHRFHWSSHNKRCQLSKYRSQRTFRLCLKVSNVA